MIKKMSSEKRENSALRKSLTEIGKTPFKFDANTHFRDAF